MQQIYEVTATVVPHRTAEREAYLIETHIPAVLKSNCFAAAFFAKEGRRYITAYHVNTPEEMERYLTEHAVGLRGDVLDRFGNDIQLSRRNLEILKLFGGEDVKVN